MATTEPKCTVLGRVHCMATTELKCTVLGRVHCMATHLSPAVQCYENGVATLHHIYNVHIDSEYTYLIRLIEI